MGTSEISTRVTAQAVTVIACGGTRRQRGAAIAAHMRLWRPERPVRVSVSYLDDGKPWSSDTTVIRYKRITLAGQCRSCGTEDYICERDREDGAGLCCAACSVEDAHTAAG